jgi:hypothetical protein
MHVLRGASRVVSAVDFRALLVPRWGGPSFRKSCTMEQTDQATPARDSCPDCHALVADLEAHERWHSRLVAYLATAVVKETQRGSAATR